MIVVSKKEELKEMIRTCRTSSVGLVPTMGALHEGHLSLIKRSIESTQTTVVSIYVNPTQFNDKTDFSRYPRTLEADLAFIETTMRKDDIVFAPSDEEIYPEVDNRSFGFGNLDHVMEALHRPGHFNGVGQVVSKLFDIVRPDMAFFGLKDFQQVAVIKNLVKQMGVPITIVPCPIIREADGLALSSRNRLLDPAVRKVAPEIYRTLQQTVGMFRHETISDIKLFVRERIDATGLLNVIYFEIVDDIDLIPLDDDTTPSDKHYYGCIAVQAGDIRLIDNIALFQ